LQEKNIVNELDTCLCGSKFKYSSCCQPFHVNEKTPATALSLMRSRFTAYAMQNDSYLLETWDSGKRPKTINFSKENVIWTKLELINSKKGCKKDKKGIVEFKAYYMQDNKAYVMNEISRFTKTTGKWLYLDGVVKSITKVGQQTSQGKNAACPCGSGKKFKRCCGK